MVLKEFKCQMCGYRFEVEIVEAEEARELRIATMPVTCPKCQSPRVEGTRVIRHTGRAAAILTEPSIGRSERSVLSTYSLSPCSTTDRLRKAAMSLSYLYSRLSGDRVAHQASVQSGHSRSKRPAS